MIMSLALAGCAATQTNSGAPTGIEGPSNRESPEEATEVQAVISDAKPQPLPRQLEGCWKSDVSKFDSFKPLEAWADSLLTLDCCVPVTYVICFDRGSGAVSFTTSSPGFRLHSLWISTEIIPTDTHTDLLFSTGDDFAVLRSIRPLRNAWHFHRGSLDDRYAFFTDGSSCHLCWLRSDECRRRS